jgi:hypothetical protein
MQIETKVTMYHLALPLCEVKTCAKAALAGKHMVVLDPPVELVADVVLCACVPKVSLK